MESRGGESLCADLLGVRVKGVDVPSKSTLAYGRGDDIWASLYTGLLTMPGGLE